MAGLMDTPLFRQPKAWWMPYLSLAISLWGILFLQWNLQPIIYLFWWEIILMIGAALIRMLFALDSQPVLDLLMQKIVLLIGGLFMGGAMIMLTVTFSFKAFETGDHSGFGQIVLQTRCMVLAYLLGLAIHYFANGQYKTANPGDELMKTFAHLLILLSLLMAVTMHFLPAHPEWNQAHWVAVAVLVIKFGVDRLFGQLKIK